MLTGDSVHESKKNHYSFDYKGIRIDPYRLFRIYNIYGILQFQSNNPDINSVDLSLLPCGMYFIQLLKGNLIVNTGKFIKE